MRFIIGSHWLRAFKGSIQEGGGRTRGFYIGFVLSIKGLGGLWRILLRKWVVEIVGDFGANVIKLESLKNLVKNVDRLPREFRDKLYLMQYRRIQY
jgi:hypothetical protein